MEVACVGLLVFGISACAANAQPKLEVVTIKPTSRTDGAWRFWPTPDGYTGMDVSLRYMVQEAYGIYDPKLVLGGPDWIDKEKFDVEAKFDPGDIQKGSTLTYRQRAAMLQPILADRFKLKVHFEKRELSVLALVAAKSGPKLQKAAIEESRGQFDGSHCLQNTSGHFQACSMENLADTLRDFIGRSVVDRTGQRGLYTFDFYWDKDPNATPEQRASSGSIYTAVQEELGLKLESATAPLQVLVIDSAEKPSEN